MTVEPAPIRCPAITHPDLPPADPAGLLPLLDRLADPAPVRDAESFPLGTLQPDGRVDLCKQGLGPVGVTPLLPAAGASAHARHLLLGTNSLGDTGARALAATVAGEHGIATVYLGCNRITAEGSAALADALATDTTVRALWLKRNPVGDTGVAALAAALRRNTAVRTLDLVNTGITRDGLAALLAALADRPRPLERLFLGGNGFGPDSADLLAALLRDAGVRELYLAANHLGDAGVTALARVCDPARPVHLGLGGNGVTPAGARALAAALDGISGLDLGRPPSQHALGAPGNTTGDEAAAALAEELSGSPLRRLALQHTGVTGRGAKRILAAVPDDTRLEYVGLGAGVPRRVKRALRDRLRPAVPAHPDVRAIGSVYR